jgi:hypothetical protein
MSATVSPRSRIRANARAPSRRCSARRCSASSRTCACRSASHWLTALSFCSATRKATMSSRLSDSRFSRSRFTCAWASRTLRRTSCLDSIWAIVANLRLPGRAALTLAPLLSTRNTRGAPRQRAATMHFMLTFDLLCPACGQSVQIVDRTVPGCRAAPSPRRRRPGVHHHRCQILVPPPVFYSQIRFPPEYPDGFTTFTPSIATTPHPHTFVIAPSSSSSPSICPFRLKVARDCPACLGFAK